MAPTQPLTLEQRAQAKAVRRALKRLYPDAGCALSHRSPLQLLVATILSAQCTDVRVNQVTKELFRKYRKPADYANSPPGELEADIRPTGFFNNKAKNIRGAARRILEDFHGEVPDSMEELLTLPGVARKTANCVLGNAFGKTEGVVVDTHVGRLARRLGLSEQTNPVKVEEDLMALFRKTDWIWLSHALILHGRGPCKSRVADCDGCDLSRICPQLQ